LSPGARDGAVIVRYFHQFYTDAGFVPIVEDTAHLALTIDMESAHLFVHWQEFGQGRPSYYIEPIVKAFLDDEQQVADMRHTMKNMLAYAMGSRLAKLRDVVEATQPSRSSTLGLPQEDDTVNVPPPSPHSLSNAPPHPPKKRQRVSSSALSGNA
jgi:hypothetical protein